jgi:L-fuconolactonase
VPQVVGVRHILQALQPRQIHTEAIAHGLRSVGANGLTFDATVRADQLSELARLHDEAAETVLVLDHLGNPPVYAGFTSVEAADWRKGMRLVAARPHALVKLSGVPWTAASRPFFEAAVDVFGVERSILGSDFPVTVPGKRRWDEVADILAPTSEIRDALRWRTAARTYGIDPAPDRTFGSRASGLTRR